MATVKIWTGAAWEDIDSTTPLPVATASILGGVKIGSGVTVAADGTISVSAPPAATVAPSNLAATAAVGTATAYARADHVHKLPTAAEVGALTQTDADARYVNITGDAMTGTLTTTGRIGIGTANPQRSLDISGGGMAFTEAGGASRSINWGDTTGIYPVTIAGFAAAGQGFLTFNTNTFGNNTAERMRIDSVGTVTIGAMVGVGTGDPVSEATNARMVIAGRDLGSVDACSATSLAESNTKAAVSFRPNPYSGYTLAIGTATSNVPYIQGVNFAGGAASCPILLSPFGGGVSIGSNALPQQTLDVNGVARAHGLTIDTTATNGGHFTVTDTGLVAYAGPWGSGRMMGLWTNGGLEHLNSAGSSLCGAQCSGPLSNVAHVRAYHSGSGGINMLVDGQHSHNLYSDSNQGTFGIGTTSAKDLSFFTNSVNRIAVTKEGILSSTIETGNILYRAYPARAWVHFSAAKAILASGNVSSVANGGVGIATITLSQVMPDANFAVHAQANNPDCFASAQVLSASQVRVWIWRWTGAAWQYSDQPCMVSIIR